MPFGAELDGGGRTRFRVWAPTAPEVSLWLEDVGRDAAGRTVLLEPFQHLAFRGEEGLEQLAQLLGAHLLLAGRLQRLAVLLGLVPQGQKLATRGRRLRRRAERRARHACTHPRRSRHPRHAAGLRRRRRERRHSERENEWNSPAHFHGMSPSLPIRTRVLRPLVIKASGIRR